MAKVAVILRCGALLALASAATPALAQDDASPAAAPDVTVVPVAPQPAGDESQPAAGHPQAAPEAPAPAAENAVELPDVVVTSQKMEQTLEETPASVSSISGAFLHDIGAIGFEKLADYTGNVSISLNHTAGTFAVRGFATPDTNPAFDPSVGAVVDGVYYGRSQFFSAFFHDIDRFEVLRGPQGTLFGKNCTAGLLNLVTEAPADHFLSTTDLLLDGRGERSVRPALSTPLGADWAVRLAGNFTQNDRGFLYNTKLNRYEQDTHEGTLRMRLKYLGSGPLTGDIEAFRSANHYNNNGFQFTRLTTDMLDLVRQYDPRFNSDISKPENSASLPAGADAVIDGVNGTINYELFPDVTLTSISAYAMSKTDRLDLDADFSPVPFIHDKLVTPKLYRQYTQELRVGGKLDSLLGWGKGFNFVSGIYLARTEFHTSDIFAVEDLGAALDYCNATPDFCGTGLPSNGTISGRGGALSPAIIAAAQGAQQNDQHAIVRLNQQSPGRAVFGQFEHFFLDEWALIGGLRWGVESKVGDAHASHVGDLIPQLANETDHDTYVNRREHDFSPKGGLKWQPGKDSSVYATWSRGYKSGGFNGLPLNPTNLEYDPEVATSKEIGAKTKRELFGGPVRLSVAAFSTDFDNLQVSTFTGGSFVVLNAAAARSKGAEMDFHWLPPVPGVSILSSLGYADARYKSYPCAPAFADNSTPSPAACQPANPQPGDPPDTSSQDLSGKPLALSSRWTGSFVPGYQFPLTEQLGGNFAVDLLYRSKRYLDVDDDPRKLQPDTTQVNARFSLASYSGSWLVTLGAHNITDQVIFDQIINQPLAPGNFTGFRTDRGRYYSMSVSATF